MQSVFFFVNFKWVLMKNLNLKAILNYLKSNFLRFILILAFAEFCEHLSAQFQTAIGFTFPSNERAVRGLQANNGNYFVLADNTNHPNSLFNLNGDLQYLNLNANGFLLNPAKLLGQDGKESAAWMEKTNCGNGAYILAANEDFGTGKNMLAILLDNNGNPIWSKSIGSNLSIEEASCIKEDGNGDFIMVGSRENNGFYNIQAVKLDCNGNQIWYRNYETVNSSIATSVTSFATQTSSCNSSNNYYVTGVVLGPNGNDEVFILNIDATTGNLVWITSYDIAPNAAEYATCIQGSCLFNLALAGELWVSGYSTDLSSGLSQLFMMKTDLNGSPLWANNYEVIGDVEVASHFEFTNIGDFMITGRAESLISPPRPATRTGNCMLMKLAHSGNQVIWNRAYDQGFASQGNSVEVLNYNSCFLTGYSYEADPPSGFDFNVLAIKTDSLGRTGSNCYHNLTTSIINRNPIPTLLTSMISSPIDFNALPLVNKTYQDTQVFCLITPQSKCDSLFTIVNPFNNGQAICCFDLFANNPTANCFNQILLNLSSGSFSNSIANPNWMVNTNGNQMTITHSSGFIPAGYVNPGNFCISNVVNPVSLNISYTYNSGGAAGRCDDQLVLQCPAPPFQSCRCDSNAIAGPNLVQNGDFSLGNVGFISNYIYMPPNLGLSNGRYSVKNSTNLVNLAWACVDHTLGTPTGNFLAVDATTFAGSVCWREIVNVNAGVNYSFCAFVNNLVNTSNNFTNPTVELWILNTLQASVTLPEIPDNWVNLSATWTSFVTGAVPIEIRVGAPVHPSGSGCDFAVDDIAFHECRPIVFNPDTCCTVCTPGNLNWNSVSNQFFITDMTVYDNKLIIGGQFSIGGFNAIAAWDGANWLTLGTGFNGTLEALEVHNGKLYAGGAFSNNGNNIAEWSGTIPGGSWNASFPGLTGGAFNRVTSLLSTPQGLVAGGAFQIPANNIARWNGVNWTNLGSSGINVPNTKSGGVHGLGLFNGNVIAGGVFSPPLNNIAQLNSNVWQNLGNGINLFSGNNGEGIKSILQFENNKLAVAGRFQEAVNTGNTVVANTQFIAQWDGTNWSAMNTGVNTSFEGIYDLIIHCGDLYAGGLFTQIGSNPITGVAHWDASTNSWLSANNHPNELIRALENFKHFSSNKCELYSAGEISLNQLSCMTNINSSSSGLFEIYPNPVKNLLHVAVSESTSEEIYFSIYDLLGKKKLNPHSFKENSSLNIDFSQFPNGVYFLELRILGYGVKYTKIVKN